MRLTSLDPVPILLLGVPSSNICMVMCQAACPGIPSGLKSMVQLAGTPTTIAENSEKTTHDVL